MTKIIARVLPGLVAGLVAGQRDVGAAIAQIQQDGLSASSLHTFTTEFHSQSTRSKAASCQVAKTMQSRFGKLLLE